MQPVVRALRILTTIGDRSEGLLLQELADAVELPVSSTHRIAAVLEREGFLIRTGREKRFLLGPSVRRLTSRTSSEFVRRASRSTMGKVQRATGETVLLAELIGSEVICIAYNEGMNPLRLSVHLGHTLPIHAASAARVLLADLDPEEARQLYEDAELTRWTPRTITDTEALMHHLELVRSQGFDICDDEMDHHVWAVAAPLRDAAGAVRAAIAVVAPLVSVNADVDRREFLEKTILSAAAEISAELGGAPAPAAPHA